MFYLVGGALRCGKTTLSKKLAAKKGIPWISSDTLESVVLVSIDEKKRQALFPKWAIRQKTKQSNEALYSQYSTDEIVSAYIQQGKSTWDALEMFVECEMKAGHSYVIEGYHVMPELADRLVKRFGKDAIRCVFLGKQDAQKIAKGFSAYETEGSWVKSKSASEEVYRSIAAMIADFSRYFEEQARDFGFEYREIGLASFQKDLDEIVGML